MQFLSLHKMLCGRGTPNFYGLLIIINYSLCFSLHAFIRSFSFQNFHLRISIFGCMLFKFTTCCMALNSKFSWSIINSSLCFSLHAFHNVLFFSEFSLSVYIFFLFCINKFLLSFSNASMWMSCSSVLNLYLSTHFFIYNHCRKLQIDFLT